MTMSMGDIRRLLRENGLYWLILLALLLLPHILGWLTSSSPFGTQRGARFIMSGQAVFWMSVAIEVFALAIMVMSYNLMFGFTGVISFGHAMFFGLGGYLVGMLLQYTQLDPNLAFLLGVLIVLAVCGVIGFVIGLVTLRLRGVYFAIFTLAIAEMVWIYFGRLSLTGGEDGFTLGKMPAWIDPSQSRINLYYVALVLFVGTFILIRRLVKSPGGTVFMAIRENEERARALGYHTLRYKLVAITIAAMMAGMAGIVHGVLAKKIGPEMLGVGYTVDALLMTIIGGTGTFTGPVIGAAGLELADTVFRDAKFTIGATTINIGDQWTLILGIIFVVVVMVVPYGVVGTWTRLRLWVEKHFARPT
ncbi:MAG TPA: branched-chain amino acid ABC transporter permease [Phototrophicaceae bacterium]|jgi:branched-chain amino acid transport system permease protein|nr:branched-chain amino acid ABC transporter permease [Phototrophicaceae bacterium]